MDDNELSQEKHYDKVPPQLRKYVFKVGNSGRPKGSKSMKSYAREILESLPEEERIEFLNSVDHKTIWEMAEGKAKQDLDVSGELTSKIVRLDIE